MGAHQHGSGVLRAPTPTSPRAPPRGRLRRCPCQSHAVGCPTIAVSSKPRSSLQTCTFSAFAAPSCGDSASVQTRGQLETGRDGNPPLPPPPARPRGQAAPASSAGGSGAPGRAAGTRHVPGTERGWVTRRCQKHRGHWHGPHRTGNRAGCGQRHCCAAPLGVQPASVFVYNLLTHKAKQ